MTDHKPLVTILSPTSAIPPLAAACLQWWTLLLAAYHYKVEFHSAKHGNADCLSWLSLPNCQPELDLISSAFNVLQISTLLVKTDQLKRATGEDPLLAKVCQYIVGEWPMRVDHDLKVYSNRQEQLTEAGCILCGVKVVVPLKYRKDELYS